MNISKNRLKQCPQCGFFWTMKFVWPSPYPDPCVEANLWRFQRCDWCKWSGDVVTLKRYAFRRYKGLFFVDGVHHAGGFAGFLQSIGIC